MEEVTRPRVDFECSSQENLGRSRVDTEATEETFVLPDLNPPLVVVSSFQKVLGQPFSVWGNITVTNVDHEEINLNRITAKSGHTPQPLARSPRKF